MYQVLQALMGGLEITGRNSPQGIISHPLHEWKGLPDDER